jgi:hypothetical protein
MNRTDVEQILSKPIAQNLLSSNIPARLAYNALDGTPRVIPIAFEAGDGVIRLFSPVNAPKVTALRANPEVALTIDTTGQTPPHILLIRGRATLEIVDGVPDGFLNASRKTIGEEAYAGFEETVRGLYKQMVVISIEPTWAKLIDFQETLPQAVLELVQGQQSSGDR